MQSSPQINAETLRIYVEISSLLRPEFMIDKMQHFCSDPLDPDP